MSPDGVIRPIAAAKPANQRLPAVGREPEIAVGAGRNVVQGINTGWTRELGDNALKRDPANIVAKPLREPQIPVRPRDDAPGAASCRRDREFRDNPGGRDPANLVGGLLREPEISVRPYGDPPRARERGGGRKVVHRQCPGRRGGARREDEPENEEASHGRRPDEQPHETLRKEILRPLGFQHHYLHLLASVIIGLSRTISRGVRNLNS
jgi:hypothetical protein